MTYRPLHPDGAQRPVVYPNISFFACWMESPDNYTVRTVAKLYGELPCSGLRSGCIGSYNAALKQQLDRLAR